MQLPEDAELDIYEEIKYEPSVMCQQQRMQDTLNNAQLEHGDILCIQEDPAAGERLNPVPMAEAGRCCRDIVRQESRLHEGSGSACTNHPE